MCERKQGKPPETGHVLHNSIFTVCNETVQVILPLIVRTSLLSKEEYAEQQLFIEHAMVDI